jgi:hypothetical protein
MLMVTIKKRRIGGRIYYYLEHSVRRERRVEKREKYLGRSVPKNMQTMKAEFLHDIYREKWFDVFDRIKKNYSEEEKLTLEAVSWLRDASHAVLVASAS